MSCMYDSITDKLNNTWWENQPIYFDDNVLSQNTLPPVVCKSSDGVEYKISPPTIVNYNNIKEKVDVRLK